MAMELNRNIGKGIDFSKQDNAYFNFYRIKVEDVLYEDKVLVADGLVIFPETYIKDLTSDGLKYLFNCDSFTEVIEKYPSEKLKEIRQDCLNRLNLYLVQKEKVVMFIGKHFVEVMIYDGSFKSFNRKSFDKTLLSLTGSGSIIDVYENL